MTSNNSQIRCNSVDLYYALYGSRRPTCLVGSDVTTLTRFPKIPKISANKRYRSPSPVVRNIIADMDVPIPDIKTEPELVIDQAPIPVNITDIEMKEVSIDLGFSFPKVYNFVFVFLLGNSTGRRVKS